MAEPHAGLLRWRTRVQGGTMLTRLLLALLMALLPLPAAAAGAACHQSAQVTAEGHKGHGQSSPGEQQPTSIEQSCLGCVAPSTMRSPVLASPPAYARESVTPALSTGAARPASPPATPPPRSEA